LPQPPAPTTQVSELTVLTITSIHFRGLSVPTPIVIVDQDPSTPYLNIYQHIFFLEVMPTNQLSDGAICNADGEELLTHCTHNANAPAAKIRHHDAECIVRDSDAFYDCHRTLKIKTFEMQRRDLRSQNCAPRQKTRPVPQCCSDVQACLIGSESAR
jgi:hypothetical protein